MTNIVVHHRGQLVERGWPCLNKPAAGIHVTEEDIGKGVAQFLAVVCEMNDCRHMLVDPIDRIGKAADEHNYGTGVDGHDPFHKALLRGVEIDLFAVYRFAAFAGDGDLFPAFVLSTGGMVADTHDGYI